MLGRRGFQLLRPNLLCRRLYRFFVNKSMVVRIPNSELMLRMLPVFLVDLLIIALVSARRGAARR